MSEQSERSEQAEQSALDQYLDADGLLTLLRELVRIESVHDPASGRAEHAAAALVAETMRGFGWNPVTEEVAPGRPNVHAVVDGGLPGPTLLFEGHTDVVTEGDRTAWAVDPFAAEVVDGRLYGRGAADMKSGLAALLFAARALQRRGAFPGRIVVAALVDEEGLMLGVKHFVARGHADGVDAAVVGEPEAEEVCTTSKGAIRLAVEIRGRMAHGAMPQHGRNPNPVAGELLGWLADYQAELQARLGEHPALGHVYLTPTVLAAGSRDQVNVIPSLAWVGIDIRTVPGVDHGQLVDDVRQAADRMATSAGLSAGLTVVDDRPPTETAVDSPVVQAVLAAHAEVTGGPAEIGGVPGATDGTILWRDAGLPVVVYGPGDKWIAHQMDEYVEVDDVVRKARVYARAAELFLGGRA